MSVVPLAARGQWTADAACVGALRLTPSEAARLAHVLTSRLPATPSGAASA